MRQEAQKLETLTELHISKQDAFNLLSSPFVSQEQHTFRVPISNAVLFLNDLERGEQYAAWPHSVTEVQGVYRHAYHSRYFAEFGLVRFVT